MRALVLSTFALFAAPGIAGIAVDLHGLLAPKTTRVIVDAPR